MFKPYKIKNNYIDDTRNNFKVQINNKELTHQPQMRILGNIFTDQLDWDHHIRTELIPPLSNRVRSLKLSTSYLGNKFRIQYVNSIFRSKLQFAMDTWGGMSKSLINKIQTLQNQAASIALGKTHYNLTSSQKERILNWLPIQKEIDYTIYKMSHKILNSNVPEEMSSVMPMNMAGHRIKEHRKFASKPKMADKKILEHRNSPGVDVTNITLSPKL